MQIILAQLQIILAREVNLVAVNSGSRRSLLLVWGDLIAGCNSYQPVTLSLLGMMGAIALHTIPNPANLMAIGFIPAEFTENARMHFIYLPTCVLTHASFYHFVSNGLYLYLFGSALEDRIGGVRFASLFFVGGIAGGLVQWATNPLSKDPIVGASGAIAALIGAGLPVWKRSRVFLLGLTLPAEAFVMGWLALQIYGALQGSAIAVYSHLGGFLVGYVISVFLLRYKLYK